MTDKGFVTKGSPDYFAERGTKIQARIDEAKDKIDAIESRVRGELEEIQAERTKLMEHLRGAVAARDALASKRTTAINLLDELTGIIEICGSEMPSLDEMVNTLLTEGERADERLKAAEKSRHRQLCKHERAKTRYEGRKVRLELREKLYAKKSDAEEVPAESTKP